MKKKSVIALVSLFTLNFISAAGSFTDFTLDGFFSDMFDILDSATLVLGIIFLISFILLNKALLNKNKTNGSTAGVIAFVISFLLIFIINKTGVDLTNIFDYLGYDEGISSIIFQIMLFQ